MKKATTFILALALLFATLLVPASAQGTYSAASGSGSIVIDASLGSAHQIIDYGQDDSSGSRANTVVDLGTSGSSTISWSVNSGQSIRSGYDYKTGSGKIVLRVNGSPSGSVIFYLHDASNDSLVSSQTAFLTTPGLAIVTFSGLFSNREYYIKAYNASQTPISITGTIAAV